MSCVYCYVTVAYVCIPHSFIVINVCNQRKNLCSPCIYTHTHTGCPTRYRTRHFFNNFTTNEDIATKFEGDLPHCVRNVKEKNVLLFKFRCNIFIGVRIIKEMPGLVASGTPCIKHTYRPNAVAARSKT